MTPATRVNYFLTQALTEQRFFNIGPISYDTELAWKLIKAKTIPTHKENLPVESYLRYVGFDPNNGPSDGFKLHMDADAYHNMTLAEAKEPGLLVKSDRLGPILIVGNMRLAKLHELGIKTMKVITIGHEYEAQLIHGSDEYKAALHASK